MKTAIFFTRLIAYLTISLLLANCSSDDAPIVTAPPTPQTLTWKQVASGEEHTVALRSDGTLWVWGSNEKGQLCDGTYLDKELPQQLPGNSWKAVACGSYHVLALKNNGTLWTWGANNYKQLASGLVATSVTHMVQVGTGGWSKIAASDNHSIASKTDGTLWTWGNYKYNEFIDFESDIQNMEILTSMGSGDWESITAGGPFNMMIQTNGTLWGSGRNSHSQLGFNDTLPFDNIYMTPQASVSGSDWKVIAPGRHHAVGLREDGRLWSWGANFFGQIGNGSHAMYPPTAIGTLSNWTAVSSAHHYSIAVQSNGTLWFWGANYYGVAANGVADGMAHLSPGQVGTETEWKSVFAGTRQVFAKKTDGTLWAWGSNNHGQLGDGTTTDRYAPVLIECPQ